MMWVQDMLIEIGFRTVTDQNGEWDATGCLRHVFHNLVILFMTILLPNNLYGFKYLFPKSA